MTAKKISELSSNTTPDPDSVVAIVESTATEKASLGNVVRYGKRDTTGYFIANHGGSGQTGVGTAETQLIVDGATSDLDFLPNLVTPASLSTVFTAGAGTKVLFSPYEVGTILTIRISGTIDVGANNTSAKLTYKIYNSSDVEVKSFTRGIGYYKTLGTGFEFASSLQLGIESTMEDGYLEFYMTFDTTGGSGNNIDPDSVYVGIDMY